MTRMGKSHTRILVALGVVGALLWGYFEWRVYPEIIEAQNDVKELRKEVYLFYRERPVAVPSVELLVDRGD